LANTTSEDKQVTLSKQERLFIYYQLLARKNHFEEDMVSAASNKNLNRISECTHAIEEINKIQKIMLNS
jgi:hypothetical protein